METDLCTHSWMLINPAGTVTSLGSNREQHLLANSALKFSNQNKIPFWQNETTQPISRLNARPRGEEGPFNPMVTALLEDLTVQP